VNRQQTDLRAEPSSASGVVQYAVTLSKLNWLIRFKPVSHRQHSNVKTVSHRQHSRMEKQNWSTMCIIVGHT